MNTFHRYNALITRVVDGDTVDAIVDLGFKVQMQIRFRLTGFDAPETYRPANKQEAEAGEAATIYLSKLIGGAEVIVESKKFGKYRYLATIYQHADDQVSVNEMMIKAGHVKNE